MTAVQTLAKFSYDGTTIYVDNIDWKNNWTNGLTLITPATLESTPNETLILNLNKVEERYTITGHLTNGQFDSETYTTAKDKKNGLKTMFGKRSIINLTLEGEDLTGCADKYEINYRAKDNPNDDKTEVVIYDVIVSFVRGGDIQND